MSRLNAPTAESRVDDGSHFIDPSAAYRLEEVWLPFSEFIQDWDEGFHQLLINDRVRVAAYRQAIRETVKPGMTVLDLGTGSGILAQWALEAGASHVYGIEMSAEILDMATERLRAAGFSGRFTPINRLSQDVTLDERVDVLISELIGNLADNESFVPILADASRRFLKPAGQQIPRSVTSYLVPVEAMAAHRDVRDRNWRVLNERYDPQRNKRSGLSESPFDMYYDAVIPRTGYLSQPKPLRRYRQDWSEPDTYDILREWTVQRNGTLTGFKGYFVARLSDWTLLDISGDDIEGGTASDSWKHAFLPIEAPIEVRAGDRVQLTFTRALTGDGPLWGRQSYTWRGEVARDGELVGRFRQRTGGTAQ